MDGISIKKAAVINAISKYATIFINLIFNAILARILIPDVFGVIVVVSVFTTFFGIFADLGIGTAVIQNKFLDNNDVDNIFSFSIRLAVVLGIAFALLSIPLSKIYNDRIYMPLGCILAFSLVFNTLNIVPNALLMKKKQFIIVGIRTILVTILSSVIAVIMALNNFGSYALAAQSLVCSLLVFVWNYIYIHPRFLWKYDKSSIKKIKNYSTFQFLFNFVNYFSRNMDNLLISKFMGEASLGYYDKAYKLMLYPTNNLSHVITPILHPILSDYQNDKEYIYEKYMKIVKILSLLGVFISVLCFNASSEIVIIIFGRQWEGSIKSFQMLSLSVWSQMVSSTTGSIYQSIGKTKMMFYSGCITSFVTVGSIIFGVLLQDIYYVAKFVAIAYNINFILVFYILIHKTFRFNFYLFLKSFIPDFIIGGVMFTAGFIIQELMSIYMINGIIAQLLIKLGIYGILFISLLHALKQDKYLKAFIMHNR